jgi:hypothetical protein
MIILTNEVVNTPWFPVLVEHVPAESSLIIPDTTKPSASFQIHDELALEFEFL